MSNEMCNQVALVWEGEEGSTRTLTYGELTKQVNQVANALRELGLCKGDVIALYMPMTAEIVMALLAIAKIGAIALPLFSGFGAGAIATRLVDADAKALFTADGTFRRGKPIPMKSIADEAAAQVPTLRHIIVLNRVDPSGQHPSLSEFGARMSPARDHWWHELVPL